MLKNEKRADELQHYAEVFINFNNAKELKITFIAPEDVAYKIKEEFLPLCYGGRFTYKALVSLGPEYANNAYCKFELDDCSELGLVTATIAEYVPQAVVSYFIPDSVSSISVM